VGQLGNNNNDDYDIELSIIRRITDNDTELSLLYEINMLNQPPELMYSSSENGVSVTQDLLSYILGVGCEI
jgi:hypothetical protein